MTQLKPPPPQTIRIYFSVHLPILKCWRRKIREITSVWSVFNNLQRHFICFDSVLSVLVPHTFLEASTAFFFLHFRYQFARLSPALPLFLLFLSTKHKCLSVYCDRRRKYPYQAVCYGSYLTVNTWLLVVKPHNHETILFLITVNNLVKTTPHMIYIIHCNNLIISRGCWEVEFSLRKAQWAPKHVADFFVIRPTRCINFPNLFCHETLYVSNSSSVHHQEFIHYTLSNGTCHTGL
jgi:hypothetical protein